MELKVVKYEESKEEKWDSFVLSESVNGTFLQTRHFLNYHGNRFQDESIFVYKGENTIVAVIPGCKIIDDGRTIYSSHPGSTFGGILFSKQFYNVLHVEEVMNIIERYLEKEYNEVRMKCTSRIFAKAETDLLDYFFYYKGYQSYDELSCYINLQNYKEEIISNFSSGKRRDYKKSLKYGLKFAELISDKEIEKFYSILVENLRKHNKKPVHTVQELLEFKNKRLTNIVEFYGVYLETELIAGTMVFNFSDIIFHTQYLAANQSYLEMFPMNYLNTKLIEMAMERKFKYFSFGISTEEHGKVLNLSLTEFKEGFGADYCINKTFIKQFG